MRPAAACLTSSPAVRAFYRGALSGFSLKFYASAAAFLRAPASKGLALIDSALPDMAGADLVSVLRGDKKTSGLVLVLTGPAPYSPASAVSLFNHGADEYFSFPPDSGLFRARLLNLLARCASVPGRCGPSELVFGRLRLSLEARTAVVGGVKAPLTALEFDILVYFLRNQGRVVSRSVLLDQVWKEGMDSGPRAVDKRIEALRRKLGGFGSKIGTVFGMGYLLKL